MSRGKCQGRALVADTRTQMLLDTYSLKKGFSELLTLNAAPSTPPPPSYLKRVSQSMSRVDPILKTLQVRPSPAEALVQAYLIHIADKSDANFRKILELKGIIRKQDQAQLVELFQVHRASPRNESLPRSSPLLTPLIISHSNPNPNLHPNPASGVGLVSSAGVTLAAGLGSQLNSAAGGAVGVISSANLQARFDPANFAFGSAIISAARDGVDRLGGGGGSSTPAIIGTSLSSSSSSSPHHHQHTPSVSGALPPVIVLPPPSSSPSLSTSIYAQPSSEAAAGTGAGTGAGAGVSSITLTSTTTATATGNLNENLRNIGKFFKRDIGMGMGGFGSRFGGGGGGGGASSLSKGGGGAGDT